MKYLKKITGSDVINKPDKPKPEEHFPKKCKRQPASLHLCISSPLVDIKNIFMEITKIPKNNRYSGSQHSFFQTIHSM